MARCGEELGVNLAVSLHAVTNEMRDQIVPLNRKYPIEELLAACRAYPGVHNARRITFEYVMLRGSTTPRPMPGPAGQAAEGHPGQDQPDPLQPLARRALRVLDTGCGVQRFAQILNDSALSAPVRTPRGQDIMAACGQLKSSSERKKASERLAEAGA